MKSYRKRLMAFLVAIVMCISTVASVSMADTTDAGAGAQKQADLRVDKITVIGAADGKDKNKQTIAVNDRVTVTVAVTGTDWNSVEKIRASLVNTWAVTGWNSNIEFTLEKDAKQPEKFVSTVAVSGVEKGKTYYIIVKALNKANEVVEFSAPLSKDDTPWITIAEDKKPDGSGSGSGSGSGGGNGSGSGSGSGSGDGNGSGSGSGSGSGGGNGSGSGSGSGSGDGNGSGSGNGGNSGNRPSGSIVVPNRNEKNTVERQYESGYKAFADSFKNNYRYSPAFGNYYYDGYFASKAYQNKLAEYRDLYAETYASNFDAYIDTPITGLEMVNWRLPSNAGRLAYNYTRGIVSSQRGVLTNTAFPFPSRWEKVGDNWMFRYTNGTYAKGQAIFNEQGLKGIVYDWEFIDGQWYAFDEYGYLGIGWLYDVAEQGWYYIDQSRGTLSGWQQIDGQWYYFEPTSNASNGRMLTNTWVGNNYVNENGVWVH